MLRHIQHDEKRGMGIGIRYVKAILEGNGGSLEIRNIVENDTVQGTEAAIQINLAACRGESSIPAWD